MTRFFERLMMITATLLTAAGAPAAAGQTLNIYTYESFTASWGPGPAITKAFAAQCECTIKWFAIQDGVAILNRLKLEGKNTRADVVLGLDTNLISEARATGLFAPSKTDTSGLRLPVTWRDDIFVPYDFAHFAVVYNRSKVKTPPHSLKQLVNGPAHIKIVLQDPRTSTPGLGFALWMKKVYGPDTPAAWRKLKRRVLTVTPGWSAAYGLFTKGEADMVLSYTTSPAYHVIAEKSDKYAAARFAEGHYLQIEVAGVIKTSKHLALARRFLAFMTGPGFQDHIATGNWMFPAGTTAKPLPPAFAALVKPPKTLLYSPGEVAAMRRSLIDEWLNAMTR